MPWFVSRCCSRLLLSGVAETGVAVGDATGCPPPSSLVALVLCLCVCVFVCVRVRQCVSITVGGKVVA